MRERSPLSSDAEQAGTAIVFNGYPATMDLTAPASNLHAPTATDNTGASPPPITRHRGEQTVPMSQQPGTTSTQVSVRVVFKTNTPAK